MDVHVVVPEGVDDPERPSGGNVYDRRVCDALAAIGWPVKEHAVQGPWPTPAPADLTALREVVAGIPDGAVVLLDGLVALTAPAALVPEGRRLRLVVIVHMPLADDRPGDEAADRRRREGAVLAAAAAVVTPSAWARRLLLDRHALRPDRVHVAEPGTEPAGIAPGTAGGSGLLCVAAVTPLKGHDVLLESLAKLEDLRWHCTCVGSLDRDPGFVQRLRGQARELGIDDRVLTTGPLTGAELGAAYATSDLLVSASRAETYGMAVAEALAHGLPVVATAVGGLPEAVGRGREGRLPALLVPPEDPVALSEALRSWLGDADLRRRLRTAARERRATLPGWSATAERVSRVIAGVA